jgi:DNA-binding PadR family transcriptional regulator
MVGGRIRRSYGLTEDGVAALRAEAQRMAEAARIVTNPETKTVVGLPGRKPRTA